MQGKSTTLFYQLQSELQSPLLSNDKLIDNVAKVIRDLQKQGESVTASQRLTCMLGWSKEVLGGLLQLEQVHIDARAVDVKKVKGGHLTLEAAPGSGASARKNIVLTGERQHFVLLFFKNLTRDAVSIFVSAAGAGSSAPAQLELNPQASCAHPVNISSGTKGQVLKCQVVLAGMASDDSGAGDMAGGSVDVVVQSESQAAQSIEANISPADELSFLLKMEERVGFARYVEILKKDEMHFKLFKDDYGTQVCAVVRDRASVARLLIISCPTHAR